MADWESRFEQKPRRTTLNVMLSAVAILTVVGGAIYLGRIALQPLAIASKTLDADNVIANYEWFHQQFEDINANGQRLGAARDALSSFEASVGDRSAWKFDDRQEWNRLHMIVLGLEGARAEMIATYNARTEMQNRDLFRGSDLPAYINPDL